MTPISRTDIEPLHVTPDATKEAAPLLCIRAPKALPDDINAGFPRRDASETDGTTALDTSRIEAIEDAHPDDLHPGRLRRFRIRVSGPLAVAMDSDGGSLYAEVQRKVADRRAAALAKLGVA